MNKSQIVKSVSLALALAGSSVAVAQEETLGSLEERAGYTIGVNIGMGIASQGFEGDIDLDSLILGIRDSLGDNLQMSQDDMMAAIREFTAIQEEKIQAQMAAEEAVQTEFLSENAARDGVETTESGLQYLVLEEGADAGAASPAETDTVNVHYHGTLIDGTVFDSSVDRGEPISFPLNGVIPGWTEGLQLMQVGDKYRFFIPSALAYGANGAGDMIPTNATLIFDVELLGIEE